MHHDVHTCIDSIRVPARSFSPQKRIHALLCWHDTVSVGRSYTQPHLTSPPSAFHIARRPKHGMKRTHRLGTSKAVFIGLYHFSSFLFLFSRYCKKTFSCVFPSSGKSKRSFKTRKIKEKEILFFFVAPSTYLICLLNHRHSIILLRNSSLPPVLSRFLAEHPNTTQHEIMGLYEKASGSMGEDTAARRITQVRSVAPLFSAQGP